MAVVRYRDAAINLPVDWGGAAQLLVLAPPTKDFQASVALTADDAAGDVTLEQYARKRLDAAQRELPGFRLLGSRPLQLGPRSGYLVEFCFTPERSEVLHRVLYVKKGTAVFALAYTDLAAHLDQARAVSDKLFATTTF